MKSSSSLLSMFFINWFIIQQLLLITIVIALQKNQPSSSSSSTTFEDYDTGVYDNNSPSNINGGHSKITNENFSIEASPNNNNNNNNNDDIGDIDDGKSFESDIELENFSKTKFSDERFARLFPSRGGIGRNGRYDDRRLQPKQLIKPKPTLPSFIKSTPPLIKVQITTPSPSRNLANQRQRSVTVPPISARNKQQQQQQTTQRPIDNIQKARNRLLGQQQQQQSSSLQSNNRQLTGRLQPSSTTTTTTTPSPSRRRYNSGNNGSINNNLSSRFLRNQNSTIPSLNPRGRN
uniref:Uncharacterized protein n=1 Tax=Dermatophagoides pteronyssinus TaxID=6956 RepID=A0A6P6XQB4_DERPT|nr:putative uncharacterized protein DDB_G0285119 [Dermatophagoides pteronyssinus]